MEGLPVTRSVLALLAALLAAPASVAEVVIDGLDRAAQSNALALMGLDDAPCDAPEWRVRRLFEDADGELRRALEAFGYYRPVIDARLEFGTDCWRARFAVRPGEPVRLGEVDVELTGPGAADPGFEALRQSNPLAPGSPLRHAEYEAYKRRFADLATRRGYFDGAFTTRVIDVYPERARADVQLTYATGPRYDFGPLRVDQDFLDERLVRRFIDFEPGEPYDAERIARLYEALLITGYFDGVDIRTTPREAELDVPIRIDLTPARPRTYTVGLGFGTDTGPKLRSGYINRRRNVAGHQFEATANVSGVGAEVGASYRIPRRDPRAEWLNFDAGFRREELDIVDSNQVKVGVKSLRRRRAEWLETRFLDAAYEEFEIGTDSGETFLILPGISWTRAVSAGPPRPLTGHRINVQFSGTHEAIGSDASFLQIDLFGKLIRPLWSGARLITRAEIGITFDDRLTALPASVRYFAGGDASVRGYDYKTLGPVDENGEVLGGSNLLVGSIEIDQRLRPSWSAALFADGGNAIEDFSDLDLKLSVGAGLRWYSPLGPIRLDVAVPLDDDAPDAFRIHVSLGPDL